MPTYIIKLHTCFIFFHIILSSGQLYLGKYNLIQVLTEKNLNFFFSTLKGKIDQFDFFPDYLKILIPTIWKQSSQI